ELFHQVDREADPLVVLVDVGERRRARARPDGQDAGLPDLVERALLGGHHRSGDHRPESENDEDGEQLLHAWFSFAESLSASGSWTGTASCDRTSAPRRTA